MESKPRRSDRLLRALPLLAVLLLGAALRLALLWNDSPPLYADELEQYVSVNSIVTTGSDIDGKLEPFLESRLERQPPMYGVAGYASTLVFGKTPFGWRLPAALFGIVAIALLYGIVLELTRRRLIAWFAALLFAIEPIQVHFARIGWEPSSVLPFFLGGMLLLLIALREPARALPLRPLLGAAVLFGLCPYTYGAASLYAVILIGGLVVFNRWVFADARNRQRLLAALTVALAIGGPGVLIAWTDPQTTDRLAKISTFAGGISFASLGVFFSHYFSHFGWPYLFATGAEDDHYMSGYGALYWWYAPLLIAGAVYAHRYVRRPAFEGWLWLWLVAYPLGGALTNDGATAHPARTIAGSPVLCIFAALGLYALLHAGALIESRMWRRPYRLAVAAVVATCALVSVWSFANWYFRVYPIVTAGSWDSGSAEAFIAVRERSPNYARICLIGFNYWHLGALEGYYLPGVHLPIFEDGTRPECNAPSTLMLSTHIAAVPGFAVAEVIDGANGKPFAVLETRAPRLMSTAPAERLNE